MRLGMHIEKLGGGSLKTYTVYDRELRGKTWGKGNITRES